MKVSVDPIQPCHSCVVSASGPGLEVNSRKPLQMRYTMEYTHTITAMPTTGMVHSNNMCAQVSAVPASGGHCSCLASMISAVITQHRITGPNTIAALSKPGSLARMLFSIPLATKMNTRAGTNTTTRNRQPICSNITISSLKETLWIRLPSLSVRPQGIANPKHVHIINRSDA